jgi:hypothetical protein
MSNGIYTREEIEYFGGFIDSDGIPTPVNMCRVYSTFLEASGVTPAFPERIFDEGVFAEILGTYYQVETDKFFINSKNQMSSYNSDTGYGFWILPQGSTVRLNLPFLNIDVTVIIPSQTEINLIDLI